MMKRVLIMAIVLAIGSMLCLPANLAATTMAPGEWTEMHPASAPSPRMWSSMVYDSVSDKVILFGGFTGSGDSETWAYDFDTDTWTNMNPSVAPSARWNHKMAYDSQSDRVIMFGGWAGYEQSGETWAYEYETNEWTNMNPVVAPSARNAHAMAYDSQSDRVILFGGHTGSDNDETWSYDFETNSWTDMNPTLRPPARHDMAFAFDIQSDRFLIFGGEGGGKLNDLWAYDFDTDTWTEMHPAVAPPNSYGTAFAYDSYADRTVMFGGDDPDLPPYVRSDTWTYDLDGDVWAKIDTSGPGRSHHAMAYDSRSSRSIMFGGDISPPTVFLGDTWTFSMRPSEMVIQDPVGDTNPKAHNVQGYLDMTCVKLAIRDDVEFSMEVAASVPDRPTMQQGVKMLIWQWVIDSDPNAWVQAPWPYQKRQNVWWPCEFRIVIEWNGLMFSSFLVDYTPMQTGGQELFRQVPFVISENKLSVTVEAWMLGDLTDFRFNSGTQEWTAGKVGNLAVMAVDSLDGYIPWQL